MARRRAPMNPSGAMVAETSKAIESWPQQSDDLELLDPVGENAAGHDHQRRPVDVKNRPRLTAIALRYIRHPARPRP
jgi:hypothetical protein